MKALICWAVLMMTILRGNAIQLHSGSHTMFPKDFIFGAATAAYQTEGGWNVDGKGPSVWDSITHLNRSFTIDRTNGDVALDSYHKYKEDVRLVEDIGFQMYRFSIAWSRVLPNGTVSHINWAGINYYMKLIDELHSKGIAPMVTLYHWDLPEVIEASGGWLNPGIVDLFADYADLMFKMFGDKVKWWITINEGYNVAIGYGTSDFAPGLSELHGVGEYQAAHNLILSHAKAYRRYEKQYKRDQGGKLSMAFYGDFCVPKSNSAADMAAADRCSIFSYGWFAHPIFKGDYPPEMRTMIDGYSKREERGDSRLPYFTEEQIKMINGTADFYGLNHYCFYLAEKGQEGVNPSIHWDMDVTWSLKKNWANTAGNFSLVAQGLRLNVKRTKEFYGNPEIFITELGYADEGLPDDPKRISFFEEFLAELRDSIYKDKCNVLGYITWSLLDVLEWKNGFTLQFGVVDVDMNSKNLTRTIKKSGHWLKNYIAMHKLLN